jgi:hypothetical protein
MHPRILTSASVPQDENRHGDFFTAILKARSEFVDSNDWQVGVAASKQDWRLGLPSAIAQPARQRSSCGGEHSTLFVSNS